MLRVRSQVDPKYEQERRVFNVAEDEPSSWSATASGKCLLVGLSLPQVPWHDFSAGQRAYHFREFAQKSVIPAFRSPCQLHRLAAFCQPYAKGLRGHGLTPCDEVSRAFDFGISTGTARSWVQTGPEEKKKSANAHGQC